MGQQLKITNAEIVRGTDTYLTNGDGSVYLKDGSETVADQVNLYGTYTANRLVKDLQYIVRGTVETRGSQLYMLWCTYVPDNPSRQSGGPVELKISK